MKKSTIILVLLIFFLFERKKVFSQTRIQVACNATVENRLFGLWTISSVVHDGVVKQYNICPTLWFKDKHRAILKSANKLPSRYSYDFDGQKMLLQFNDGRNYFGNDSVFYYNIKLRGKFQYLELNVVNSTTYYRLLKNK